METMFFFFIVPCTHTRVTSYTYIIRLFPRAVCEKQCARYRSLTSACCRREGKPITVTGYAGVYTGRKSSFSERSIAVVRGLIERARHVGNECHERRIARDRRPKRNENRRSTEILYSNTNNWSVTSRRGFPPPVVQNQFSIVSNTTFPPTPTPTPYLTLINWYREVSLYYC